MSGPTVGITVPAPLGAILGQEPVWGLQGTGIEARIGKGDSPTFYVDSGNAVANDNSQGTNPYYPLATVQELMDRWTGVSATRPRPERFSTIFVSGTVAEDVITPAYGTGPGYWHFIGAGATRYGIEWTGAAAATASLDVRLPGCRFTGFRFEGKTAAAAVVLRHTDSGANDIAIRTVFDACYFDGLTTGLTGIESHGCYDVWIVNCTFLLWNNVANTAVGMRVTTTPLAIPYRNYVVGNVFQDSDNGMIWPSNGSTFMYNTVKPVGYAYTMVQAFNTSLVANPGDDNIVTKNDFGGDFSIAGGYRGGAADEWFGNFSPDIAEAEVADNGIVILPPA